MSYSQLSTVRHRLAIGLPLPFNVRDANQHVLLARGQVIATPGQLDALLASGALVDMHELMTQAQRIRKAPRAELPALWDECTETLLAALRMGVDEGFRAALDAATAPALTLIERDPDLAIFQVLRPSGGELARYGLDHSLQSAITAVLVARRLGWSSTDAQRAFMAAMTMNLSMLELQGELAAQTGPLTEAQRAAVRAHPTFSMRMLEAVGVTDPDWLDAVATHHEALAGADYPRSTGQINELAALIRRADIYLAKLSPRGHRPALAADAALQAMRDQDGRHPTTIALGQVFGPCPPGCSVRLVSRETGVVLRRGSTPTTPVVAVLESAHGQRLAEPRRTETSQPAQAVHAVLAEPLDLGAVSRATLAAL